MFYYLQKGLLENYQHFIKNTLIINDVSINELELIGRLAQSVERGANNAKVVGSRPTLARSFLLISIIFHHVMMTNSLGFPEK